MQNQSVDVSSTSASTSSSRLNGNLDGTQGSGLQLCWILAVQHGRQPGLASCTEHPGCRLCCRAADWQQQGRRCQPRGAPDGHIAVPPGSDLDIEVHPESAQQPPSSPHHAEDWHVPGIVEHAGAVEGQAVCVQPKVAVAPKVRQQDVAGMLLQHQAHPDCCASMADNDGARCQYTRGCCRSGRRWCRRTAASTRKCRVKTPTPVARNPLQNMDVE